MSINSVTCSRAGAYCFALIMLLVAIDLSSPVKARAKGGLISTKTDAIAVALYSEDWHSDGYIAPHAKSTMLNKCQDDDCWIQDLGYNETEINLDYSLVVCGNCDISPNAIFDCPYQGVFLGVNDYVMPSCSSAGWPVNPVNLRLFNTTHSGHPGKYRGGICSG